MKKLIAAIRRAPKRVAAIAIVAGAVLVPAALFAWGPDRPTFTMENPAPYVTFNSITDNPVQGDERNFVQIKDAGASGAAYGENVDLQPGKNYDVYVYYHNNAASNLNDAAHNYKGIAKDAFMRVQMPATVAAGASARVTGFVGASNANPAQVWDEAYGKNTSAGTEVLRYVPGSAVIHSAGAVNGQTMPDSLFTTGAPLGYDKLDGTLPGCSQYAGYVVFQIHVDQPNFTIQKTVSPAGQNKYAETADVKPGDKVDYKIEYENTGTVQQDNVIIKDKLPAGMSYVAGSTQFAASSTGGKWTPVSDNGVVDKGINIGSYAPGGNAYVKFTAQVADNDKLPTCGPNTLVNTATVDTENGSKSDTATVDVTKTCETPPVYTCNKLTVAQIDRTHFKFSTDSTVKNATYKSTTYVVRDSAGTEVYRSSDASYTQTKPGNYTVQAYVTVSVNGSDKTVTSDACKANICVKPQQIKVCRLEDKQIVTIDEDQFDSSKYSKNLNDCEQTPTPEQIEVCRLSDKQIVTINEDQYNDTDYSRNLNDCQEVPTPPTPPVTPPELPQTGMNGNLLAVLGIGSLIAATAYYVASRRALGA